LNQTKSRISLYISTDNNQYHTKYPTEYHTPYFTLSLTLNTNSKPNCDIT
jgi:hypothetical protein